MGLIPYENEKYQDWSDEGVREKMRAALSTTQTAAAALPVPH